MCAAWPRPCATLARQHGGHVGDVVGDEILVHFDGPTDALRSTIETMQTLAALNARNPSTALRVHVGLDFGPGVVERNEVRGDVVKIAPKRCQATAGPDEVVISADLAKVLTTMPDLRLEKIVDELKGFGTAEVFKVHWRGK